MENKKEPYLASPARTCAVLKKYGFNFKKKYGQNFLIDGNVLEGIVDGAGITKDDVVLEIGPGIGTMTQYLSKYAKEVVSVEIDDKLIPILKETLEGFDNVSIINGDILKIDIAKIMPQSGFHVVANLPYYITTPIVMGLLEKDLPVKSITVMVQSEVADRMQARPGTKDYGALTLAVNYYSDPQIIMEVSPKCFIPEPNVESKVINLKKKEKIETIAKDKDKLFKLIKGAFAMRRKTLVNSLSHYDNTMFPKEKIEKVLIENDYDVRIRGEKLTLKEIEKLSNFF